MEFYVRSYFLRDGQWEVRVKPPKANNHAYKMNSQSPDWCLWSCPTRKDTYIHTHTTTTAATMTHNKSMMPENFQVGEHKDLLGGLCDWPAWNSNSPRNLKWVRSEAPKAVRGEKFRKKRNLSRKIYSPSFDWSVKIMRRGPNLARLISYVYLWPSI